MAASDFLVIFSNQITVVLVETSVPMVKYVIGKSESALVHTLILVTL